MIQALYSRPKSSFIQDRASESFDVWREVRQGNPRSPSVYRLYVLAFEPLLQMLSRDIRICNFRLPPGSPPVALFAYADDLSICLPDEAAIFTVLDVLDSYCRATGARKNRSKSAVMYMSSVPTSAQPVHGLAVQARLRILGFLFEPGDRTSENGQLSQEKLEAGIRELRVLSCPLNATVTIARSLLLSFLTYVACVSMPVANRSTRSLEQILFRFLRSSSCIFVGRPVLKVPRNKGGLGIPGQRATP